MSRCLTPPSPFKRFNSSPEIIRLAIMMYVHFPLSLRNVEDLLAERGLSAFCPSPSKTEVRQTTHLRSFIESR